MTYKNVDFSLQKKKKHTSKDDYDDGYVDKKKKMNLFY